MATLQATKITSSLQVDQNTYIKLGNAYISSGGPYAHLGQNSYYNGSAWSLGGPSLQLLAGPTFNFIANTTTFPTPLTMTSTLVTVASTSTSFIASAGNGTTNSAVGIGAAASTVSTDGKLLINSGDTTKPVLEATNCAGDAKTNSHSTFAGWLAVKIGSNVGASAATTGTWYIQLWS
jgi:hypothetical protein